MPKFSTREFNCLCLNGSFVSDRRFLINFGDLTETISLEEAYHSSGEWMGVFTASGTDSTKIIAADPFGYQPVFYRFVESPDSTDIYVATSPGSLTQLLVQSGVQVSLNFSEVTAALSTQHPWSRTAQSNHTFGKDVKLLLPGQYIYISSKRVGLSDFDFFVPEMNSYDELLDQGISKALAQLESVVNGPIANHRINLSGGKDSRIMAAMLTASGLAQDFTVTSMNPKTWSNPSARPLLRRDLYLSDTIRKRYGMRWTEPSKSQYMALTFEESLQFWQTYRSGTNYGFNAQRGYVIPEDPHIELRGAAGETFRGFQAVKSLLEGSEAKDEPGTLKEDIYRIIDQIYDWELLSAEYREEFGDKLTYLLSETLGAAQLSEGLYRRYAVFRNRSHFGHIRYSMAQNAFPVLPLSQPEFLQAAQLIDPKKRDDSLVAFDVIEKLNPELNDLAFESNQWPDYMLKNRASPESAPWQIATDDSHVREFYELEEQAHKARSVITNRGISSPAGRGTFDPERESRMALREMLGNLTSLPGAREYLTSRVEKQLLIDTDARRLNPKLLVGKLASAHDFLLGRSDGVVKTFYFGRSQFHNQLKLATTTGGDLNKGFPSIFPTVDSQGSEIIATAMVRGKMSGVLEYAFYLQEDDKTIQKQWYSPSNTAVFKDLSHGKRYSIKMFARYADRPQILFKTSSKEVVVS